MICSELSIYFSNGKGNLKTFFKSFNLFLGFCLPKEDINGQEKEAIYSNNLNKVLYNPLKLCYFCEKKENENEIQNISFSLIFFLSFPKCSINPKNIPSENFYFEQSQKQNLFYMFINSLFLEDF